MGHQFDWFGIRRDEPEKLRDEIRRYFAAPGAGANRVELEADRAALANAVAVSRGDWSAVHPSTPLQNGGALMCRLSRNINAPAIWMRIPHDFWEYRLYIGGKEVDRFSQVPERSEPYAEDLEHWKGKPAILASAFGVTESAISKYLVTWPREAWDKPADYGADTKRFSWGRKAHADDEFPVSDYWVMCDFARRIGLAYDMPAATGVALEL